jgi:hypothetical protein
MGHVVIAADIFNIQGDRLGDEGWEIEPTFLVAADDLDKAAAALQAAGHRFLAVNPEGQELPDWEEARGGDSGTPSNVSPVQRIADGVLLRVNTKGWLSAEMARSMLRILTEELDRRGTTAHVRGVRGFVQGEPWRAPGS